MGALIAHWLYDGGVSLLPFFVRICQKVLHFLFAVFQRNCHQMELVLELHGPWKLPICVINADYHRYAQYSSNLETRMRSKGFSVQFFFSNLLLVNPTDTLDSHTRFPKYACLTYSSNVTRTNQSHLAMLRLIIRTYARERKKILKHINVAYKSCSSHLSRGNTRLRARCGNLVSWKSLLDAYYMNWFKLFDSFFILRRLFNTAHVFD